MRSNSAFFAKATLLKGESRAEYESLQDRLWKSKQPGDEYEELLLDMIVSNVWRQLRGVFAENEEILIKSEFLEFDRGRREQAQAEEISQRRQAGAEDMFALEPKALIWNIHNSEILERCIELLVELREGIKTNGFDQEVDGLLLKTIYGDPDKPHFRWMLNDTYSTYLDTARVTKEEKGREGYPTPEECKQIVLREITAEITKLTQY
jgi:hypothetical protein